MKIVRIVSELDFGGVEQVMANSIPDLFRFQEHEITVIVLEKGGKVEEALRNKFIPVTVLGKKNRIPNSFLISTLVKLIYQIRPDVVHTQGAEANFHGILASWLVGVPRIIGEEIGLPNHHSYWKWIFKWVYQKANRVIAISEAVKNRIVELGEVREEKVKVIYNPVCCGRIGIWEQGLEIRDEGLENREWGIEKREKRFDDREQETEKRDWRKERTERKEFVQWTNLVRGQDAGRGIGNRDKSFVFITTCRLVPIKNLDRLVQAFEGLLKGNPDRQLYLRIVGEGPERGNLELLIKNLKLDSQVEFLGFQSDVWPFLLDADAFVLPSLQEGSSVSLAEAMTAGLPCIVTQVGGAVEILGDSQSGFLIDPLDVNSIQTAMQQILDLRPEQRQAMGERAKKESRRFSVENYITSLLEIYRK